MLQESQADKLNFLLNSKCEKGKSWKCLFSFGIGNDAVSFRDAEKCDALICNLRILWHLKARFYDNSPIPVFN